MAALLPEDEASLLDPIGLSLRLAVQIQQENAGFFLWVTLALLATRFGSTMPGIISMLTRRESESVALGDDHA